MIGDAPLSQQTGVPGWHTNQEAEFLIQLAEDMPDGVTIVCVGVEYGRCVSEIAFATRNKKDISLTAVDLFPATHHLGDLLEIFKSNMVEIGVHGRIDFIQGDSPVVAEGWKKPIHMLFIDAGHHYEEVRADIAAWFPHVVPGGLIIFHDYAKSANAHPQHLEVKQAVDEAFGADQLLDGPDSIVYLYSGMEVSNAGDDLTVIDGIGPTYAEKLRALEITTFNELYLAEPSEIALALGSKTVTKEKVQEWQSQAEDYL